MWEVQGIPTDLAKEMPRVSILDAYHPLARLKEEAVGLLQDPVTRLDAVATICETYLEESNLSGVVLTVEEVFPLGR